MIEIVAAAVIQDKKVLMVDNHGNLSFPGGTKEKDESDSECLTREFREEFSGTLLTNLRPYRNFGGISPRSGNQIRVKVYFADVMGSLKMPDGKDEDVKRAEWITYPTIYKTAKVANNLLKYLHIDNYL